MSFCCHRRRRLVPILALPPPLGQRLMPFPVVPQLPPEVAISMMDDAEFKSDGRCGTAFLSCFHCLPSLKTAPCLTVRGSPVRFAPGDGQWIFKETARSLGLNGACAVLRAE